MNDVKWSHRQGYCSRRTGPKNKKKTHCMDLCVQMFEKKTNNMKYTFFKPAICARLGYNSDYVVIPYLDSQQNR